jgi:hypothetical protein
MTRRFGPCFSLRRLERPRSCISNDRLRTVCVYEAPDAETTPHADPDALCFACAMGWAAP